MVDAPKRLKAATLGLTIGILSKNFFMPTPLNAKGSKNLDSDKS